MGRLREVVVPAVVGQIQLVVVVVLLASPHLLVSSLPVVHYKMIAQFNHLSHSQT